jgi:plasmid rolling circle replication initiator protein Rep
VDEERKMRVQKEIAAAKVERTNKVEKVKIRNKKRAFKLYAKQELHSYQRVSKVFGEMKYARIFVSSDTEPCLNRN